MIKNFSIAGNLFTPDIHVHMMHVRDYSYEMTNKDSQRKD